MGKTEEIEQISQIRPLEWPDENTLPLSPIQNPKGKALHQVFHTDTQSSAGSPGLEAIQNESKTASFLGKVAQAFPRWIETPTEQTRTNELEKINSVGKVGAIQSIPVLDNPERIQDNKLQEIIDSPAPLPKFTLPTDRPSLDSSELLLNKEEVELYVRSIKDLNAKLFFLLKGQLALEQEQGLISKEMVTKLQDVKKSLDKVLEKIEKDLEKEDKIAGVLGKIQAVSSLATTLLAFASFIPGLNVAALGIASTVGAVAGATATAGKAYFNAEKLEHTKESEDLTYKQNRCRELMKDSLDRMVFALETSTQVREQLIKISRLNSRLTGMIFQ